MIQIIHADVIDGLKQIPDQSVQCVVTSPPYIPGSYELRDLNRKAILIELNAEYIKIARERLRLNEQLGAFA